MSSRAPTYYLEGEEIIAEVICQRCGRHTRHRLSRDWPSPTLWTCLECQWTHAGLSIAELHTRGWEWEKRTRGRWVLVKRKARAGARRRK